MKAKRVEFRAYNGKTYDGLLLGTRNGISRISYRTEFQEDEKYTLKTVVAYLDRPAVKERVSVKK